MDGPGPPKHRRAAAYRLDEQVGFLLRLAQQRHTTLFAECFEGELTPTQWAVVAKLRQLGQCSQNLLGRHTAMDVATIQGVVDRLRTRGLVVGTPDKADRRRLLLTLSPAGLDAYRRHLPHARAVSERTLAPLDTTDRETLIGLLARIV